MSRRKSRNIGRIASVVSLVFMLFIAALAVALGWPVWVVWSIYIALGIIPAALFVVTYWWKVPRWSHSIEGRHMMALTSLLLILMVEQLLMVIFGDWWGHDLFVAAVVFGIVMTLWQRYTMLLLAQREYEGTLTEDTLDPHSARRLTH